MHVPRIRVDAVGRVHWERRVLRMHIPGVRVDPLRHIDRGARVLLVLVPGERLPPAYAGVAWGPGVLRPYVPGRGREDPGSGRREPPRVRLRGQRRQGTEAPAVRPGRGQLPGMRRGAGRRRGMVRRALRPQDPRRGSV
jgi:hypothetical protein